MEKEKIYKLGEVCKILSGKTPDTRKKEYWENGIIPWFTQQEITTQTINSKKFITQKAVKGCGIPLTTKNSVLLCNINEAVAFYPAISNLSCNQQVFVLEPNIDKIEPNYLYYLLCAEKKKLNVFMRGTIFKSLTLTELKNFSISLPSLQEQTQILQKFQIVYDKIFKSEIVYNNRLLEIIKTILEYADLLFLKYKDSQIKIKDHFKLARGKTPPTNNKEYYENGTIKWINSGVLTNLYFLTEYTQPSKLVTEKAVKECQLSYAENNSVLISGIDFNVDDKIVWNQTNNLIIGTGIYNFLGKDKEANTTLFFSLRNARKVIIDKICLKGATQFTSVRGSELINFPLWWVSDPAKQKIFFTILNSKLAKIKDLHSQIKDLLLLKYFGKKK